ncbi:DUF5659 domain-containing protein [Patescibacteria group bacterium]
MKKVLDEKNFFKSSDLALSAFVAVNGYVVEFVEKISSNKLVFNFKRDQPLDELIQAFWRGETRVEPQTYFYQLKSLKTRLYEERQKC